MGCSTIIRLLLSAIFLQSVAFSMFSPDSTLKRYNRDVDGRPFSMEDILGDEIRTVFDEPAIPPDWYSTGRILADTVYYGIGHSDISQTDADDQARLEFAKMVEVKVNSIARQAVTENAERLTEEYSFESLVSTDMSLRGLEITERFTSGDDQFHSLLLYGKSHYHQLLTDEIRVQLEEDIKRQQLRMSAEQTLRADSLRHKLVMDSLVLAKEQARVDSLQKILDMERALVEQQQEERRILGERYSDFLELKPYYRGIDGYTAALAAGYGDIAVRWNPKTNNLREFRLGSSISIVGLEGALWFDDFILQHSEISFKLLALPPRGEIYKVSLMLGITGYASNIQNFVVIDLQDSPSISDGISTLTDPDVADKPELKSSFLVAASLGIPQYNMHLSLYGDKRRITLTDTWFPFVHNLGDALSLVAQVDYFLDDEFANRFEDRIEGQIGLRVIAIEDRFATILAYEDNEWWRLTFELQF